MKQIWIGLAVLTLAACTQEPAEVSYKGDEFFGRVHEGALDNPNHETFAEDSPRIKEQYARPVEQTPVQSVGVSDLPPPTAQAQTQGNLQPHDMGAHDLTSHNVASRDLGSANREPAKFSSTAKAQGKMQFIWPVEGGKIVSHFGPKPGGRSNDGVNIAVSEGEPIWAAAGGTVVYSGSDLKGYGNMIIIRHSGGWMSAYAHARSLTVAKGATVKQGDIIGYVGMTGGVKTPQVHFALRDGRTPVDPELYLAKNG